MKRIIPLLLTAVSFLSINAQSRLDSVLVFHYNCEIQEDPMTLIGDLPYQDTVNSYDVNGNLIARRVYVYRTAEVGMIWILTQEELWDYNEYNLCTNNTRRTLKENWNGNEWIWDYKNEYTYNDNIKESEIRYYWNIEKKEWQIVGKDTYTYNNSLLVSIVTSNRNEDGQGIAWWRDSRQITYTYNDDNLLVEEIMQESYSSSPIWINKIRKLYTYTPTKLIETYTEQQWNEKYSCWDYKYDLAYEYDAKGNLLKRTRSEIRPGMENPAPHQIKEYTYENDKVVTYRLNTLYYNTNQWIVEDSIAYRYDTDGDLYAVIDYNLDMDSRKWLLYQIRYHYYANKPAPEYFIMAFNGSWFGEGEPGEIQGIGRYAYNTQVQLYVVPTPGYEFVKWDDGNTDNPRTFVMNRNYLAVAFYEKSQDALTCVNVLSTISTKLIIDNQLFIFRGDKIYNAVGVEL